MRRLLVGLILTVLLVGTALAASTRSCFFWLLPAVPGDWDNGLSYAETRVDIGCDGPHRVYIVRTGPVPASNHAAIAVIPNGCVTPGQR